MVEHDAYMPNVNVSNEMEHVSQVTHHVSNVLDDVSKVEDHHFLCFGYPRTFVQYTNASFKYGPCFRGCDPFPIRDTNMDESTKGGVKLKVFTNMETSIQVPSHHNLG
jgi:hypothetical protein